MLNGSFPGFENFFQPRGCILSSRSLLSGSSCCMHYVVNLAFRSSTIPTDLPLKKCGKPGLTEMAIWNSGSIDYPCFKLFSHRFVPASNSCVWENYYCISVLFPSWLPAVKERMEMIRSPKLHTSPQLTQPHGKAQHHLNLAGILQSWIIFSPTCSKKIQRHLSFWKTGGLW